MESWLQTTSTRSIQLTGLKIALVVGTILNLINQGDSIMGGNWELIHWPKLMFTYCVPYCVAVFAGTHAKRS
ncbi:nitrate/nitrite transporter NrtS [Opitutia bacterium ISCC 51]|nr:nitrate/nitrite transporter NrtS [Opitutae bacterium ISCC 51]QXD28888.1 nitrate/nitrite transporter NrtS [Opitutae bacterium ISCC 52]